MCIEVRYLFGQRHYPTDWGANVFIKRLGFIFSLVWNLFPPQLDAFLSVHFHCPIYEVWSINLISYLAGNKLGQNVNDLLANSLKSAP